MTMILFMILMIMLVIMIFGALFILGIAGGFFVIIFADVIICIALIVWIVRRCTKKKKK